MAAKKRSGRKKRPCHVNYKANGRREQNKIRRLRRTVKEQPNNRMAQSRLDKLT